MIPWMTGFISSPHFVDHLTGPHHPERPDRIRAVALAVRAAGVIDSPNPFPQFHLDFGSFSPAGQKLLELPAPAAADEKWLRLVHPQSHVDHVRHVSQIGGGVLDQGDTQIGEHSFDIAKTAVGAVLSACDAVVERRVVRCFAAVRPPGHHAEPNRAMGFCLFANVSIGARYLQQRHGVGKVAIVDFDVHHGNGTQAVFIADPSVMLVSLHQDPRTCYPGTGYAFETGAGNIVNLPMEPGSGDAEYLAAFHARVLPAIDAFRPELLMISAGFDAHREDPLAQINLSEACYEQMTRLLAASAEVHCQGQIVSALEGGYNLRALGRSVVRHLAGLAARD